MTKPVRVLFFCPSLAGGGAETHLTRLLNHFDRDRFSVGLALASPGGVLEPRLPADVDVWSLRRGRPRYTLPRVLGAALPLRRLLLRLRPDVLCSILDHAGVAALIAARGISSVRRVVCVQNTVSMKYSRGGGLGLGLTHRLMRRYFPRADRIVAASRGVGEDLETWLPVLADRVSVIHNAVFDDSLIAGATPPAAELVEEDSPRIVACGRLTRQKGFPYLLRAVARVRETTPVRLWIVGEGEDRRSLEEEVRRLGLGDGVQLIGFDPNPYRYMSAATVFVCSSLWEGFGNVIVEAMACGAPVVVTDCPHGPAEIVRDGVDGLLVPPADSDALAESILRLLRDRALAEELARNGAERARTFSAATAAELYGELFEGLAGERGGAAVER